jgi:phycobilisome rod-core linker protein
MSLPLLEYPARSQNSRVKGFEGFAESQPVIYTTENQPTASEMDALIMAAYRQVCNEQQMLDAFRQRVLESQLRMGQITVREFIRGLALSDNFRRWVYEANNNYRFVQICIQRLLGREVYNEREKIAWSAVLMTKGISGFVDELLNSEEYLNNFGEDTVPYQRKRKLRHRPEGEVSFEHMARYGTDYRDRLADSSYFRPSQYNRFEAVDLSPEDRKTILTAGILVGSLILIGLLGSLLF